MQWRTRVIETSANKCGKEPEGLAQEVRACATQPCTQHVDCVLGQWTAWSKCSAGCSGQRKRSRRIDTFPSGDGKWCEDPALPDKGASAGLPMEQVESCNPPYHDAQLKTFCEGGVPVDCKFTEWTPWTPCSKSCFG